MFICIIVDIFAFIFFDISNRYKLTELLYIFQVGDFAITFDSFFHVITFIRSSVNKLRTISRVHNPVKYS